MIKFSLTAPSRMGKVVLCGAALVLTHFTHSLELPTLPQGLESTLPALPAFSESSTASAPQKTFSALSTEGFLELRHGQRLHAEPHSSGESLSEIRLQLALNYAGKHTSGRISGDLVADALASNHNHLALNQGHGYFDLREAWLLTSIGQHTDIKAGRQILTWGVGDQVFINDLFPKDWNSFLIGRDQEYLKAPSDAVKLALYFKHLNVDLVWTPEFDSDRFIDGQRVSFYNPTLGHISGRDTPLDTQSPRKSEVALRLHKNLGGIEYALYGYTGYWKSPNSFDPITPQAIFTGLRVFGASIRSPLAGGLLSGEVGTYHSTDDAHGSDPFVSNSEFRWLIGFEREIASNMSGAIQWYAERIDDYSRYRDTLSPATPPRDKTRQVFTSRITWLRMNQNLEWSLFTFYSPTDNDWFSQPRVSYKYSDQLRLTAGVNLFRGKKDFSFFGQLEENSNAYVGARLSF